MILVAQLPCLRSPTVAWHTSIRPSSPPALTPPSSPTAAAAACSGPAAGAGAAGGGGGGMTSDLGQSAAAASAQSAGAHPALCRCTSCCWSTSTSVTAAAAGAAAAAGGGAIEAVGASAHGADFVSDMSCLSLHADSSPTHTTPTPTPTSPNTNTNYLQPPNLAQELLHYGRKLGFSTQLVTRALSTGAADANSLLAQLLQLSAAAAGGVGVGTASAAAAVDGMSAGSDTDSDDGEEQFVCGGHGVETTTTTAAATTPAAAGVTQCSVQQAALKHVVIDGSNVAMSHGNKQVFSCRGIRLAVEFFRLRGHTAITVFVPMWRKEASRPDSPISDGHILLELERERVLVFTPSRVVDGRRITCYDDRYILQTALDNDGVVVSNDNYRDLHREKQFKAIVEERILMFTFVNDRFMPPNDPLGKNGPSLELFLRHAPPMGDTLCPYGKKCTYGNKCKYNHPERGDQWARSGGGGNNSGSTTSITTSSSSRSLRNKTFSLPPDATKPYQQQQQQQKQHRAVTRTRSLVVNHFSSQPPPQPPPAPPPASLGSSPSPASAAVVAAAPAVATTRGCVSVRGGDGGAAGFGDTAGHRPLSRQLTLCQPPMPAPAAAAAAAAHAPLRARGSAPPGFPMGAAAAASSVTASARPPCLPLELLASPPSAVQHHHQLQQQQQQRAKLYWHLSCVFPEHKVQQAMLQLPLETDPNAICALILRL